MIYPLHFAITNNVDCSELVSKVYNNLLECCQLIAKIKDAGCLKWKDRWITVGIDSYNTAVTLLNAEDSIASNFFELHLRYQFQFEGASTTLLNFNNIHHCLKCLSDSSLAKSQLKNALAFSALCVFFSCTDGERRSAFRKWMNVKCASKNSECSALKLLTVTDVLKGEARQVQADFPGMAVKLNKKVCADLLLAELIQYNALWQSKEARSSVFNQLQSLVDGVTLGKELVVSWVASLGHEPQDVGHIVEKCFKQLESETAKKKSKEHYIYLGLMHWVTYRVKVAQLEKQICEDMEKVSAVALETVAIL